MNEILQRIDEAKHVVVIAHVNPDADSLGSASAFYTHLLRLHKKVSFFCQTKKIEQKLSCVPWFEKVRSSFPSSADLAISFDCAEKSRLGVEPSCDLINIDHHQSNTRFGRWNLVESAMSTTILLYNFFEKNGITINKKMATAIYAGVLDDSSGFLDDEMDRLLYSYDATRIKVLPELVVIPETKEEVQKLVKICYEEGIPVTPRSWTILAPLPPSILCLC